jgi:HKD family nuclease
MVQLLTERLLQKFTGRIASASQVDIAVAWVTPSEALERLRKLALRPGIRIRVAVGLSGNGTHPEALRSLQKFAEVRICHSADGIFHPKFYLFRSAEEKICWVGSANFTLQGFMRNSELVNEFSDDGTACRWFERLWDTLEPDSSEEISQYIKAWKPSPAGYSSERPPPGADINQPLGFLIPAPRSWGEYMAALRKCDAYWKKTGVKKIKHEVSVLDPAWSWTATILTGKELVRREKWAEFTDEEINVLLPKHSRDGAWELLGSMQPTKIAVPAFVKNHHKEREAIRNAIAPLFGAPDEDAFVRAAVQAFTNIHDGLKGFGPAIATRFITLARPDRGVSVNAGSAPGLAELRGLPSKPGALGNAADYGELLRWVYGQPWYKAPRPKEPLEQTVWGMRAALIDCFVYKPKPPPNGKNE